MGGLIHVNIIHQQRSIPRGGRLSRHDVSYLVNDVQHGCSGVMSEIRTLYCSQPKSKTCLAVASFLLSIYLLIHFIHFFLSYFFFGGGDLLILKDDDTWSLKRLLQSILRYYINQMMNERITGVTIKHKRRVSTRNSLPC